MRSTVIGRIIEILIAVVFCTVILIALLWFVHTFDVFKLPSFIDRFFDGDISDSESNAEFESNFLKLLENENYTDSNNYEFVYLTQDKALSLLSSIEPENEFFWEVETTVEQGTYSRVQSHSIYKKGDRVRIDTVDESSDTTIVIASGITIIDNNTGEISSYDGDTEFVYSELVNIASLEQSLASAENIAVNSIALVEIDNENYLYIELMQESFEGVDKYFVSLDHGLVLIASSTMNGAEYYSQKTIVFDNISRVSDKIFSINDLEKAMQLTHR